MRNSNDKRINYIYEKQKVRKSEVSALKKLLLLLPLFLVLSSVYAAETICVYDFYSPGCPHCADVSDKLNELSQEYPQLDVQKINVREDPELFLEVQDLFEVPSEKLSIVPKVFFGEDYFTRTMGQLGTNILIRSHQPRINPVIYNNKCLTLMTSYFYTMKRLIAIADLEKSVINSVDDLEIIEI